MYGDLSSRMQLWDLARPTRIFPGALCELRNEALKHIDPWDPDLSDEVKAAVYREARDNPTYFFKLCSPKVKRENCLTYSQISRLREGQDAVQKALVDQVRKLTYQLFADSERDGQAVASYRSIAAWLAQQPAVDRQLDQVRKERKDILHRYGPTYMEVVYLGGLRQRLTTTLPNTQPLPQEIKS